MMLAPQADLSRPSASADSWGRYYTAEWVGKTLVKAMHAGQPKMIVELGAGRGALAGAAGDKWRRAHVVTVDTDPAAVRFLERLAERKVGGHKHHLHDALDDDLAERIGLSLGSVDVAVCNPPYVRPRWRTSFGRILEDAGLSGALKSVHDAGADLLFIAQNLRFLKKHGKLGLVLPDGLITAERYADVRRTLLREHFVEQVVQLPRRAFTGTEAQTYLVVLSKQGGQTNSVTLRQMGIDGTISSPVSIDADMARRRLDYAFHVSARDQRECRRGPDIQLIRDVTLGVTRGSISSHEIARCTWPVFHLGDFSEEDYVVPRRFRLSQVALRALPASVKVSMPGDILVARIGRNLHEKVALVEHGPCVVSDCVFTVRVDVEKRGRLLSFLTSQSGARALEASAHGVGARYLSSSDLLDLEMVG
nr:N-6 DNA methylase [uncultured Albidiferax sp.]